MDEGFAQNARSAEELALLQAFDAMDLASLEQSENGAGATSGTAPLLSANEMLAIFVGEVDTDLTAIRQIVRRLEPEEPVDASALQTLQRLAHKIKGTSGAIGCTALPTIAHYLEEVSEQITHAALVPFTGLHALVQTLYALEMTLNSVATYGTESDQPLAELEAEFYTLNMNIPRPGLIQLPPRSRQAPTKEETPIRVPLHMGEEEEAKEGRSHKRATEQAAPTAFVRVDTRRFEQLVLHTEELAELQAPLKDAQTAVEQSLQELHVAQARLLHVELLVSTSLFARHTVGETQSANDERPTSSLIARIIDEAAERTGHLYQRKSKYPPPRLKTAARLPDDWDTLEMDQFTENDVLLRSLDEAVADVATATAQLRIALTRLNYITQAHLTQASHVRNDTLLLRLTSFSSLLNRIERAVKMSTLAQQRRVEFEVAGEATEIDQDILEELKQPLLQLVRTCTAQRYEVPGSEPTEPGQTADRIWLHVQAMGNEVVMELGFSMTMEIGPLHEVQEAISRLHGSITVRQGTPSGIVFVLRLPRSQGAVRGLLVRVGKHKLVVPFAQVQRIEAGKQYAVQERYSLLTLLGFPLERSASTYRSSGKPVLLVPTNSTSAVIEVDEILGDVELVVKPMAPHIQRPGIIGTVIDGLHHVMLVLDIPELLRHHALRPPERKAVAVTSQQQLYGEQEPILVLVADDSVYIRQSVRQTLSRAGYHVIEAEDGLRALKKMVDQPPDALVLDMEMPNLNGYDVLSMMRVHPELAHVKVIMLTSRSSEKHQSRARELGAHVYLTKPCPDDHLLTTLHKLLTS